MQDFTRKSYYIRIEYCHKTLFQQQKKSSLSNFRYDFLIILVDVLPFKDPDLVFFRIRIRVAEKYRILWIRITDNGLLTVYNFPYRELGMRGDNIRAR